MNIGILSTETHPLIKYYLVKLYNYKIKNLTLIFDRKKTSIKDKKIFNQRTKGYFNVNINLFSILKNFNIEFFFVESHNSNECLNLIKKNKLNYLVNCGTPRKIDNKIIKSCKLGILNVHPGILPKYKGRSCVEWSIFNNDKVGNTLHLMNNKYDSGPIIKKKTYSFSKNDDYYYIRTKVYEKGVELVASFLKKIQNSNSKKIKLFEQKKFINNFYDVIDRKKLEEVKKILKKGKYKYQT
tara:strand:- start:182 stop:901 length:720 start_codon:yes stop_codon:yes gene_type:complete